MARPAYDVVIVGARCAGAPLATFLARAGTSVLLLDRIAAVADWPECGAPATIPGGHRFPPVPPQVGPHSDKFVP